MYVHAETEKTTFSCKDDCTLTKHTRAGHIPLCGILDNLYGLVKGCNLNSAASLEVA